MKTRLVICCDGTWNEPEIDPSGRDLSTNVAKVHAALLPSSADGVRQIIFYDKGVGTSGRLDRIMGGSFGVGLWLKVQKCYEFIATNFELGDELFMFGFSRGAHTVQAVCMVLATLGVLQKHNFSRLKDAYRLYRIPPGLRGGHLHLIEGLDVKHQQINITFVGVWDLVGTMGIPISGFRWTGEKLYEFLAWDRELPSIINQAFHAVAIDEHRKAFAPRLWMGKGPEQVLEQVWFPGAHSNIGGGYPDTGLSDVALQWLISKAQSLGLSFDNSTLSKIIDVEAQKTLYEPRHGFYKLLDRYYDREIGTTYPPSEYIHYTAAERLRCDQHYRPHNLVEALDRRVPITE